MREPNTTIGEIGIHANGRDWLLRPSLLAISSLGTPAEIVQLFAHIHSAPPKFPALFRAWERDQLSAAYYIIAACCISGDHTELLGHQGSRYSSWVPGAMPAADWMPVARALLRHGIIGNAKPKRMARQKKDFLAEFNAAEYAALAMAHLGLSEDDAWNMTMTSFGAAMKAKFGEPEEKGPSLDQHDEAMKQLAEINAVRGRK